MIARRAPRRRFDNPLGVHLSVLAAALPMWVLLLEGFTRIAPLIVGAL